jgi:hypothetical protein
MPRLPTSLDQVSFWLGFIAATLFWWLLGRVRPLYPALRDRAVSLIRYIRERNLSGANTYLRKQVIQKAQHWHVASSLFSLDDLLIQPWLLAPPVHPVPGNSPQPETISEQVIPYLPDWPEIPSRLGYPRLTLAEALSAGSVIAVIGQPGSGKTVCLAHLACQVARRETASGILMDYAPLLLHGLDLPIGESEKDLLAPFYRVFSSHAPVYLQGQIKRLITERFREGHALILLDGLDELNRDQKQSIARYLKLILDRYPGNRLAISSAPEWIDGLSDLNAVPLAIVPWSKYEYREFLQKWSSAWEKFIAPQVARQTSIHDIPNNLLNNWLVSETGFFTPLEWTLKIWGAYSGDLQGPTRIGAIETYLNRFVQGLVTRPILEKLAHEFVSHGVSALKFSDLDRLLTEQTGPRQPTVLSQEQEESEDRMGHSSRRGKKRDLILSTGEQILETLINSGLLAEHPGEWVRFTSPAFAGILSATQVTIEELGKLLEEAHWPLYQSTLHYLAARSNEAAWMSDFIDRDSSPMVSRITLASRWLADAAPGASWRPQLFRSMVSLIQDTTLPLGLRARLIAGFTCSGDPSIPRFFRQLFSSPSPETRRLSLLGAGAFGDPSLVDALLPLLGDPEEPVRLAACLALGGIVNDKTINALAEVLIKGDENMRQAAAETLATLPESGYEMIKEAATLDDILTRRAAVFGLMRIRTAWAIQTLETMAIEDSQWVVRNAATQALETLQTSDPHIPQPLPKPWECGWLIAFAARHGLGVLPNAPANDLIHRVLTTGSPEEQQAALEYARTEVDDQIIRDVYAMFFSGEQTIAEAALQTIWYWAISGVPLPQPHQVL